VIPTLVDILTASALAARDRDVMTVIDLVFNLGIPLFLFIVGWLIGGRQERAHLRNLAEREAKNAHILRTDLRSYGPADPTAGAILVTAEVVIGSDYFKAFLASLRKLIGGNLRTYETLMARARREVILRLIEEAHAKQFNALCCIRLEQSNVGKGIMPMVAVVATATAYRAPVA
jgi:uncharacterized protein YbjQ (UPF0145 family)